MDDDLGIIYAVTNNSVWEVFAFGKDCPYAEKIATKKGYPVGTKLTNGTMIAIAKHLQFYYPEGHSMLSPQTSEERRLEHVNIMWWGAKTSPIVALFLSKDEALSCFIQSDLNLCDQRWIDKTKEVIERIGENHPYFTVCHYPPLSLLPD